MDSKPPRTSSHDQFKPPSYSKIETGTRGFVNKQTYRSLSKPASDISNTADEISHSSKRTIARLHVN